MGMFIRTKYQVSWIKESLIHSRKEWGMMRETNSQIHQSKPIDMHEAVCRNIARVVERRSEYIADVEEVFQTTWI